MAEFFFFNRILRLKEAGLIDKWASKYVPKDTKCSTPNRKEKQEPHKRLSLSHLSGAFAVLIIGYSFAFLVFLVENVINFFLMPYKLMLQS